MRWLRRLSLRRVVGLAILWPVLWVVLALAYSAFAIATQRAAHPDAGMVGWAVPVSRRSLLLPPLVLIAAWIVARWIDRDHAT
jgi:hypothetical protein